MSKFLLRPSALHLIMTEPRSKTSSGLSVTAMSYLKTMAKEAYLGFESSIASKYLRKGNALEDDAIDALSRHFFKSFSKNEVRLENDYLSGEPDIIEDGWGTHDSKVAWSLDTFPVLPEDVDKPEYYWQGVGYMMLTQMPNHGVHYAMLSTPKEMLGRDDNPENHTVDHIPLNRRITSVYYERDLEVEAKVIEKHALAAAYFKKCLVEIKKAHGEHDEIVEAIEQEQQHQEEAESAESAPETKPEQGSQQRLKLEL